MVKSGLVERVASRNSHLHRRDIDQVVDAILGEIADAMARGQRVELRGFGVFSTKRRPAHIGLNPLSGVKVPVAEKLAPFFKTGKEMRERLNSKRRQVLTQRISPPPTSYAGDIPRVWLAHIHRLEAELKKAERELRVAEGVDARAARARVESIRNQIARFR